MFPALTVERGTDSYPSPDILNTEQFALLESTVINDDVELHEILPDKDANVNPLSGKHLLHVAIKNSRTQMVDLLLNRGADVNARNSKDLTPLHVASMKGQLTIAKNLLNKGACVDSAICGSIQGWTPLHCAIAAGNQEITELLLKHNACVDALDTIDKDTNIKPLSGNHPLHVAIENNRTGIVDLLVNRGADVNARNSKDLTPLHVASVKGQLTIAEKLLNKGACVDSPIFKIKSHLGWTPLHCAVAAGNREITELLLKNNACVDARTKKGWTPLDIAVYKENVPVRSTSSLADDFKAHMVTRGDTGLVKLLLKHGAKVDTSSHIAKSTLHLALSEPQTTIVAQFFVSRLSDYNKISRSFLLEAVDTSKTEYDDTVAHVTRRNPCIFFKMISQHSDNLDPLIRLFLHAAVENGCLRVVQDFLKFGVDVNALDEYQLCVEGLTLLHAAVKKKRHDIVRLLINHGVDVNAKYKNRDTPIYCAIKNSDGAMTKLLLSKGACIKDRPCLLNTAAEKASAEIVEILLQQDDIDINATDEYGNTALHSLTVMEDKHFLEQSCECVKMVKANIAKRLLSHGASVNARNNEYLTPLHAAAGNGYAKVVKVLLQYNADAGSTINNRFLRPFNPRRHSESKVIFNKRVQINVRNVEGKTPLHMASARNHDKVVKILLACGADIDSKDLSGKTAIDVAFAGGCRKTFIALLKYCSDFDITHSTQVTPQGCRSWIAGKSHFGHVITSNVYCAYLIRQHIIKMKAASRFVSKEHLRFVDDSDTTLARFHGWCKDEIEEMAKVIISGNVSFIDIVTRDVHRLAMYARNKSVAQTLESKDYTEKFSIYSNFIECQFRRGRRRERLLNMSLDSFTSAIEYSLPADILIGEIFRYLRNEDLENLIEACEG